MSAGEGSASGCGRQEVLRLRRKSAGHRASRWASPPAGKLVPMIMRRSMSSGAHALRARPCQRWSSGCGQSRGHLSIRLRQSFRASPASRPRSEFCPQTRFAYRDCLRSSPRPHAPARGEASVVTAGGHESMSQAPRLMAGTRTWGTHTVFRPLVDAAAHDGITDAFARTRHEPGEQQVRHLVRGAGRRCCGFVPTGRRARVSEPKRPTAEGPGSRSRRTRRHPRRHLIAGLTVPSRPAMPHYSPMVQQPSRWPHGRALRAPSGGRPLGPRQDSRAGHGPA